MIIKDKFELLKNVPNVLNMSKSEIKSVEIEKGPRKIFATLELVKKRITHFTKNEVFNLISDIKEREKIHVVNLKDYILPVSYNKPTDGIVINLSYFNTDDVSRVSPRNIYACVVYGITLRSLLTKKSKLIKNSYYSIIVGYLTSVLVRIFAKEYGLLGLYSDRITKLKFLISCYVVASFFGIKGDNIYKLSSTVSLYGYKDIVKDLRKYNFSSMNDFIKSLSNLNVMPGMEKYKFTSKLLKMLGINFLAAFEDVTRFVSVLTTSNISGSNVTSTFLFRYNEYEFSKILLISKSIF